MIVLSSDQIIKYLEIVDMHRKYVYEGCEIVNSTSIGLGIITLEQMLNHDLSKYSREEFVGYAAKFIPNEMQNKGDVEQLFNKSWLHHIHNNPHHWQHWIIPNGEILEMPKQYAAEMVGDWLGASRSYTGSWNMSEWLDKNLNKVILHDRTKEYVSIILQDLGYSAM